VVEDIARARLRPPALELLELLDTLTDELLLARLDVLDADAEAAPRRCRRSDRLFMRAPISDREQRSA